MLLTVTIIMSTLYIMKQKSICISKKGTYLTLFLLGIVTLAIYYFSQSLYTVKVTTQSRAKENIYTYSDCKNYNNSSHCAQDCNKTKGSEYKCITKGLGGFPLDCCKVPECTAKVSNGGGQTEVFSKLFGNYYATTYSTPNSVQYLNLNGSTVPKSITSYQAGDVVSLLPQDHKSIECRGQYLGNIFNQIIDDYTARITFKGNYMTYTGFQTPITFDQIQNNLGSLCRNVNFSFYDGQGYSGNIYNGCNFTTLVKTGAFGGINKCEVFSTVGNAFDWLQGIPVNDTNIYPSSIDYIKTIGLAVFSQEKTLTEIKSQFCK